MASRLSTITKWLWRGFVLLTVMVFLVGSWPNRSGEGFVYDSVIRNRGFDFVEWEIDSLSGKALYGLAPPHARLTSADQSQIVLDFLDLVGTANQLRDQITTVYSDPSVTNPDQTTEDLRKELDQTRQQLEQLQPLAEGVLEEQIATVLADNGMDAMARVFPPVQLHFTPLPSMLVVSRRDKVEAIHFSALEPGLSIQDWIEIEDGVADALDVSTLVTPIGGLAAYPAMMYESSSINWVAETGAHEWTHHYLTLHPLGILYDTGPDLRTMNETVASVVGSEIGAEVIRRYYPDFVPPPMLPSDSGSGSSGGEEPQGFDFRAEMRKTRIHVDELLAQGKIEEAEQYMEERRQVFWDNGHHIRKLNQAYFAFNGAYADEPGQRGEDPVGPAVLQLRQQSASLAGFLREVAGLTSFQELQKLVGS